MTTSYPRSGKAYLAALVVLSMVVSIGASYYFSGHNGGSADVDAIAKRVVDLQRDQAIEAIGGQENYDLKMETEKYSFLSQKDQAVAFVKQAKQDLGEEKRVVTADQIAAIKKDSYISGNPDGRFLLLEYSDLECPYCIRQAKDGTIQQVLDAFPGQIGYAFRNFRGVNHAGTEAKAKAALCVGEASGGETYLKFVHAIFAGSDATTNVVYPVGDLSKLAGEVGADTAKFDACMTANSTLARFNAETAEGSALGVTGTPGTIIIDTKTNEYTLVSGAYPATQFTGKIQAFIDRK